MSDELILKIESDPGSDEAERVELARHLRQTLLELNEVESIGAAAAPVPPLSKGVGAIAWQTLLVTLAPYGGVLAALISTVQTWLSRHQQASITIKLGGDELVMTGVSSADQKRLMNEWLRRHKA